MNFLSQTTPHSVQEKQKLLRRETPKTPRFTEKNFSATLGDLGEVRRINSLCLVTTLQAEETEKKKLLGRAIPRKKIRL
jgi:hypothetical protein